MDDFIQKEKKQIQDNIQEVLVRTYSSFLSVSEQLPALQNWSNQNSIYVKNLLAGLLSAEPVSTKNSLSFFLAKLHKKTEAFQSTQKKTLAAFEHMNQTEEFLNRITNTLQEIELVALNASTTAKKNRSKRGCPQ